MIIKNFNILYKVKNFYINKTLFNINISYK